MTKRTCTRVMYIMIFLATVVNTLIRVNISIAVLDMVRRPENSTNKTKTVSRYYEGIETRFEWNEWQKNTLLGSFFWGNLAQAYVGYLTDTYGPKIVCGCGLISAAIITILTPLIATCHYYAIVASRILIGVLSGSTWTSIMPLATRWIPATDRATFLAVTSGGTLGAAVILPLYGQLISWIGWASVFYASGAICALFSCLWFYLIYDSPNIHPRISRKEKTQLNMVVNENKNNKNRGSRTFPWKEFLISKPMWASVLVTNSTLIIIFFMITQLNNYMDVVHNMDIKSNGLYSSLPYIGNFLMILFFSVAADKMVASGKYKTLTVRRLFLTISSLLPSLCLAVQTIFGDVKWACILLFSLIQIFGAAAVSSNVANVLDIAPNYGATILGLSNTVASASTILLNELIGFLTKTQNTFEQWRYILIILMVPSFLSYLFFMVFASDQVQLWNLVEDQVNAKDKETFVLKHLIRTRVSSSGNLNN